MSSEQKTNSNSQYYSIIDGNFRIQVSPDHPEVVVRPWESTDGKSGTKYERIVHSLTGIIENIQFKDGDYGTQLNIMLDKNEARRNPIMSFGTATPYGESMLKLLPNLREGVEYCFRPYSFKDKETDKDVRGVEVTSRDEEDKFKVKVLGFFYDIEKKEAKNGYPIPDGDTKGYKSDDWKLFYLQARKFLVKYAEANVLPRFAGETTHEAGHDAGVEYPADEVNPEDIPF